MSHDMEQLLARLNEEQRAAVEADPGPLLVLAGAGSGKTRVLTHRIAHMIQVRGVRPWNIMAVTFTNKAAEEMGNRVARLLEGVSDQVQVSTFHSTAALMLRRHIEHLGYGSSYVIYDDSDQTTLLKRVLEDLNVPKAHFDPRAFRAMIDRAKNNLEWPHQVTVEASNGPATRLPVVYARYQERLKAANALDFGDLLLLTVKLLEEHEDVRQFYHERVHHLLIDEYQDTNRAQYRMAQLLTHPERRSICVVGDEDQSIYAFRGADISNILNFTKDFPDAKVVKLEQNYRSTTMILKAAGAVVAHNRDRLGKNLWTDRSDGEPLHYMETDTDAEEAAKVAEEIRRLKGQGTPYGDVAVFYRANAQSRLFEEVFNYHQIPYHLVGQGFYDRKEIKDMRAYLQLIFNPLDDASLDRILNEPARGIGDKARDYLFTTAASEHIGCYQLLENMAINPAAHAPNAAKLLVFYRLIEKLRMAAKTLKLRELLEHVLDDTGYRDKLVQTGDIESESRLENLRELLNVTADFDNTPGMPGLQRFLERVSLRSQSDEIVDDQGAVTLMTFHNAKGLEFPVAFMVGMEERLFPHSRTLDDPEQLEEERRLCYVGMTRAMNRLYLTRARRRRLNGETMLTQPSRFLKEVPAELMTGKRGLGVGGIARRYGYVDEGRDSESSSSLSMGSSRPSLPPRPGPGMPVRTTVAQPNLRAFLSTTGPAAPRTAPTVARDVEEEEEEAPRQRTVRSSGGSGGPFGDLQVGRRVQHPTFGEGMIKEREGPADNPRLTIQFRTVGSKKLMARYAALELVYR